MLIPSGTGSQSSARELPNCGEGAEPVAAHDLVAELEAGDAVADRDDLAGALVTRG